MTQVSAASKLGDYEILDARAPGRFRGDRDPNPAKDCAAATFQDPRTCYYRDLLNEDGTMKSRRSAGRVRWQPASDMGKAAITSCGSGVTAAIINLALERVGKTDHALYDGSWTEWGAFPTVPVATGDN